MSKNAEYGAVDINCSIRVPFGPSGTLGIEVPDACGNSELD